MLRRDFIGLTATFLLPDKVVNKYIFHIDDFCYWMVLCTDDDETQWEYKEGIPEEFHFSNQTFTSRQFRWRSIDKLLIAHTDTTIDKKRTFELYFVNTRFTLNNIQGKLDVA